MNLLIIYLCNYITKELVECFPGGQGNASTPYWHTVARFKP